MNNLTLDDYNTSSVDFAVSRTSRFCTAARRMLAFVECSSTQEQKKLFIQWNTAYYQFRLIIRHVMNGITHVFSSKYGFW